MKNRRTIAAAVVPKPRFIRVAANRRSEGGPDGSKNEIYSNPNVTRFTEVRLVINFNLDTGILKRGIWYGFFIGSCQYPYIPNLVTLLPTKVEFSIVFSSQARVYNHSLTRVNQRFFFVRAIKKKKIQR